MLLLTNDEFKTLKNLGNNLDSSKVIQAIEMAQNIDLKNMLGDSLYFDLINNPSQNLYQDLISGSTFTINGITYHQAGIKQLLADYAMAKYVISINTNFTPFGSVIKKSDDSEPTDRNTLKDVANNHIQLGGSRWETIKMYLDYNQSIYPKWVLSSLDEQSINSQRTFRFRKI